MPTPALTRARQAFGAALALGALSAACAAPTATGSPSATGPSAAPALSPGAPAASAQPPAAQPPAATAAAAAAAAALPTPAPAVQVTTLVSGLAIPWDLAFLPDSSMIFTERAGTTRLRSPNGTLRTITTSQSDLFVGSESGLMGITVDPAFASNRRYYTCQAYRGTGTAPIDIRVIRWTLAANGASAARTGSPVVAGLPITSGRHGGCRLRFATDGVLNIGTGDAAVGTNAQDLTSLGGKTLRVNSDGTAPADNPFFARGGRAALVWSYGHRNVQGMALRPGTSELWNVEHGPSHEDEVNKVVRGGNYGWDPVPGYNEAVVMTDRTKFPNAIPAVWNSGPTTVATSGAAFLSGSAWGRWEGALAIAELKGAGVRILRLTPDGRAVATEQVVALDNTFGRIRTVQSGPGNSLYLTTSNGTNDHVLRVTPVPSVPAYRRGVDVSPSGVAAVARGNAVTAFSRSSTGLLQHSTQALAGGAWTAWQTVPGAIASAPAAVAWDGNRVDVFARGTNGHVLHTFSTSVGGSYSAWEDIGGIINSAPSVASTAVGTLDVVGRAPGDAVWRKRFSAGRWGGWSSIGGITSSAPAARADRTTGIVTVYARGQSPTLFAIGLNATGIASGWGGTGRLTASAAGVSAGSSPVLITRSGYVPALQRGAFATSIEGALSGAPAAATRPDGSYVVIGRGGDNALWAYDGRSGRQFWSRVGGSLA